MFASEVLYLVDDLLILALGLEVEVDASDGANDTTDAATQEKTIVYAASIDLIDLVEEPSQP